MAKFPTEVTESVVVPVALADAYAFFWDVVGSARCIPGLDRCDQTAGDVYRFIFQERSTGPVSMCVTYTARYTGNGTDESCWAMSSSRTEPSLRRAAGRVA